ncbi:DUF397 domain-containing protein [Streptomyces sp. NBC_00286]|uniref:DUF397 domain-containing protein n=1 Tax=Streptomyces sp. NBC_00286 TaxID=2975701 RepID=UPI002E2A6F59|nr:DUF397 domain-containing protein [Streptomyces sp. NBC_00286]
MSTDKLAWFKSSYSSGSSGDCLEVALDWRKSSYSGDSSGDCLEVAADWRKSSHSSGGDGDCIEIATRPTTIHVRDSKNTKGPQLTLSPTTWTKFVTYAAHS